MLFVRILRFLFICLVISRLILPQWAAAPGWWADDTAQTRILIPGATPSNFGPANLGQLKYVASQAKRHLDQKLAAVGGAGDEINALVASFEPRAGQNYDSGQLAALRAANYAPINLGQLKAVAKPFYKRLMAVGYGTRLNLIAHGYPATWGFDFPWNPNDAWNQAGTGDKTPNYAMANIGQLKMAFSFDLTLGSDETFLPGTVVGSTETGMSAPNEPPDRLGNGGNTTSSPTPGTPTPGAPGPGAQLDPERPPQGFPPPWLWAYDNGDGSANVTWIIYDGTPSTIKIERRAGTGSWEPLADLNGNDLSYTDSDLLARKAYTYRMTVTYTDGQKGFSNEMSFIPQFVTNWYAQFSDTGRSNPGFTEFVASSPPKHYLTKADSGSVSDDTNPSYPRHGSFTETTNKDRLTGNATYSGSSTLTHKDSSGQTVTDTATRTSTGWSPQSVFTVYVDPSSPDTVKTDIKETQDTATTHAESNLSNEYTAKQFFQDTIAQTHDYNSWQELASWVGPLPVDSDIIETLGNRARNANNDRIDLRRSRIKVQFNPAEGSETWARVFVPYKSTEDFNLDWSKATVTGTIEFGGPDGEKIFDIDPAVEPDEFLPDSSIGHFYFIAGPQLDASGTILDTSTQGGTSETELDDQGKASALAILRPEDSEHGIVAITEGFQVKNVFPNVQYVIHISNTSDFVVIGWDGELTDGQTLTANDLLFGFTIIAKSTATDKEPLTISISGNLNGQLVGSDTVKYTTNLKIPDFSVPFDEASGSRYRKIALNGRPLADEKPQQTAESDEEKEETYVDALTLGLHHSTTDIYVPIPGSDVALSARRDTFSEVWNMKQGLRPHERLDRPFGAGWSSNLCVFARFEFNSDQTAYVYVNDQNGATHRFALVGPQGNQSYVPLPSDSRENGDYLTKLVGTNDGVVFTDRYGTQIVFDGSQILRQDVIEDRLHESGAKVTYFERAKTITDRFGDQWTYSYPIDNTLIPATIVTGSGLTLSIAQDGAGQVTHIWDPNGNQFSFDYKPLPYTYNNKNYAERALSSVTGPNGEIVQYDWTLAVEPDKDPAALAENQPVDKYHVDLTSITDAIGKVYTFTYQFDNTRYNYSTKYGYFQQTGGGSCVTSVSLPGSARNTIFSKGASLVELNSQLDANGEVTLAGNSLREAYVTDAGGNGIHYTWGGSQVFTVGELANSGPAPKIVFYTTMNVSYTGYGSESFEFDPTAGLALKSVTDFSGNTTSYVYGDHYTPPAGNDLYNKIFPWAGFATAYPDPTQQTDALGNSKTFQYSPNFRIMNSVTDEEGRTTVYGVDNLGRRTSETVSGQAGVVRLTNFAFSGAFPGAVTLKTVVSSDVGIPSLVTKYDLDGNGRVQNEIADPNGLSLTTTYSYDSNGNKLSSRDPNGNTTRFQYDGHNRLTKVVYADGSARTTDYYPNGLKQQETVQNFPANEQTLFEYDGLKRLTKQTSKVAGGDIVTTFGYDDAVKPKAWVQDPNGHTTNFEYDGLLRLTKTTDALGQATDYSYIGFNSGAHAFDSSGFKPITIKDPRGYVTTMTYDGLYRAIGKSVQYQLSPALYSSTNTRYDKVGNPVCVKDPLLHATTTDFDALNRPTHVHYADGTDSFTTYTSTGLKWKVKDELGRETETQYDAAGRAVAVLEPSVDDGAGNRKKPTTKTEYDAAGNVSKTTNPLGKEWTYNYDVRNRKIEEHQPQVTDAVSGHAASPAILTGYDYVGNVIWTQDARGFTTETSYDQANRPVTVTAPPVLLADGTQGRPTTTKTYDPAGNVLTVKDANGHITTNCYDKLNRLEKTTDAANITVRYGYDAVGNRISVKDGLLQETTLEYDGLNRNTKTTDAAGKITTLGYDALNKITRTDALVPPQVTSYGYDLRNRLTAVTYSLRAADNRGYGYDLTGHLLSVTETGKTGADVVYTYDELHRVSTETSNGATHTYTYDLAGNRLTAQYGQAGGGNRLLLVSSYDDLNRLQSLTEGTRPTTYGYDLSGNVVTKTLPNGDAVTTHYDSLGRAYEEEGVSTKGVLYHYLSLCDAVGNLRNSTEYTAGVAPRKVAMDYDNADRLTSEVVTDLHGQQVSNTSYDYDAANNRLHKTANGVTATYAYNTLNQLTSWSDTAGHGASYGYDLDGNRVSRTVGVVSDLYTYDGENRLIGLTKSTTDQASTTPGAYGYTYDYRTRRVTRTENNVTTKVAFSGGTSVQEYSASGLISAEYVRGSDWGGGVGGVLYSLRGGSPSYDHYDRRGDVTARTDSAGTVTWQASYEAFGTRPTEYGTTQDRQKANTKEEDPTGLLNEGMRYRDLETGTFITRDPAGFIDGPNLYAYVRQNPWGKFDPEGLNETWGGDNWFANWVLPDPVAHYHASQAGAATMFDGDKGGIDRVSGGLTYLGNGMMTVLSLIPGEAAVEGGIERLAGKAAARAAERETAEVVAQKVEQKVAKEVEDSASKTAKKAEQAVEDSGGCFAKGTLVLTPNGSVPIENLHQGDAVLSYDFQKEKVVTERIESLFRNITEYWVTVEVAGEKIKATRGHRFWVPSLNQWVPAVELKKGMTVHLSDGKVAKIDRVNITHLSHDEKTYNFFVASEHVYFVGIAHILVHNGDSEESSRAARREAMRQQDIPTSQQPSSQRGDAAHKQYTYEVPEEGGGTKTKVVTHHEADPEIPGVKNKHPDPHWEAGDAKLDDQGKPRTGNHGEIKYESDKAKVIYKKKC